MYLFSLLLFAFREKPELLHQCHSILWLVSGKGLHQQISGAAMEENILQENP